MAVQFDPSKLTDEQQQTYAMQKQLQAEQSQGQMMNLMLQHEQQQQKERFDLLSNTMKAGGDTKANIANNLK
jgi:hypothetical protein